MRLKSTALPLPPAGATQCTDLPGGDCAIPIVQGQPGYPEGYRPLFLNLVSRTIPNIGILNSFPSIAIDSNDPASNCLRGGNVYVAYAAEENPNGPTNPADCSQAALDRTIDSNIYVVHGRFDPVTEDIHWSAPVMVPADTVEPTPDVCGDVTMGPCGRRFAAQFYPWIAVDQAGRVGVMFFDTMPDTNRCDGNTEYRIQFAYSLDGGVTWEVPVTVSEVTSQTSPDDRNNPAPRIIIGEYMGMTATAGAFGYGVFHPIWIDLRDWAGDATLANSEMTAGDTYTAAVTVETPPYSMGDFDHDGDVDMDDFKWIDWCAAQGLPMPPECEILDLDRDNDCDSADGKLMQTQCFTGKGAGSAGQGTPNLSALATFVNQTTAPTARAQLANSVRANAQTVTAPEAQVMQDFANSIDPQ